MEIDAAIDGLFAAIEELGLRPPHPPKNDRFLKRIERKIAPLTLPAELRVFWQRADPLTVRVSHGPELTTPDFALKCWREARTEGPGVDPPNLLLIGYESWSCLSIELDAPSRAGGSIWEWALDDDGLARVFPDLTTYLTSTTEMLRARRIGDFEPGDEVAHIDDHVDDSPFLIARQASQETAGPKRYDVRSWPPHWRRAAGFEVGDDAPLGATHTIAALLATDAKGPAKGRIHGTVIACAGDWIVVEDDTGEIGMLWPPTLLFGPRLGDTFELEIALRAGARHPQPQGWPESDPDDVIDATARSLYEQFQPTGAPMPATLTGARPLS